jgi:hypothetical protein
MPRPDAPHDADDGERLLPTVALRARYACGAMTVERWLRKRPDFPRPVYVGARRYWRLSELRAWESGLSRQKSAEASTAAKARVVKSIATIAARRAPKAAGGAVSE